MGQMKIKKPWYIDVGNTVAVSKKERLIVDIGLDSLDPPPGFGVQACVNQGYSPWVHFFTMNNYLLLSL